MPQTPHVDRKSDKASLCPSGENTSPHLVLYICVLYRVTLYIISSYLSAAWDGGRGREGQQPFARSRGARQ